MTLPKTRTVLATAGVLVVGYLVGRACATDAEPEPGVASPAASEAEAEAGKPEIWTCSMHPQVRLNEPGKCPICFMDLIPAASGGGGEDLGPRSLQMTKTAMALAEIETATVGRRRVAREVEMVGKVAFDETRLAYITAWVAGRLDRLFVDYTGVAVRRGDHMVEIYSPTLYSTQQELLQAIATVRKIEKSSLEILRETSDRTVVSAREKLRLYGLSTDQIQAMVERGTPDEHITIMAPIGGIVVHKNALEGMYVDEGSRIYTIADLSKVWVLLDAYESDLEWLRYGQDVEFRVEAYPGETFHGRVAFIDPVLDDRTRTVKVRLNVENPHLRLKPDMFVSATAQAVLTSHGKVVDEDLAGRWMCPMHPEVIADGPGACTECGMDLVPAEELGFDVLPQDEPSLVIPATAALVTGKRAVVYVRLPDRERPTFEGREINLGPRAGDWYVVYEGLEEGEQVVVKGNFKIDSELQIRAKPSMMSPEGGASPPPHHGGGADATEGESPSEPPSHVQAPEGFRKELGAVVDAYLQLQGVLTRDEDSAAMAQGIVERLAAVDMGLLQGEGHLAWMKILPGLRGTAEALAAAEDLAGRRAALGPLTDDLVEALRIFGYARDDGPVGVFHCPMALGGKGADWIQAGEETTNPYYGSSMLRCGDRVRVLPQEQ